MRKAQVYGFSIIWEKRFGFGSLSLRAELIMYWLFSFQCMTNAAVASLFKIIEHSVCWYDGMSWGLPSIAQSFSFFFSFVVLFGLT